MYLATTSVYCLSPPTKFLLKKLQKTRSSTRRSNKHSGRVRVEVGVYGEMDEDNEEIFAMVAGVEK
jgi:hypothetical protein